MRKAFTMVELIFVIVILGILAAVAIPKLSATRDDARVSALAHSIVTAVSEVVSYAVSQEDVDGNITGMSHVLSRLVTTGDATLTTPNSIDFKIGTLDDCVTMQTVQAGVDTNLTITFGPSTDAVCNQLQGLINLSNYSIPLKGEAIAY